MIFDLIRDIFGPVISGLWSHLNLCRYGIYTLKAVGRQPKKYSDESTFWQDLIGSNYYKGGRRRLKVGDFIELNGFQLSEWFPRSPGLFWTKEGNKFRQAALSHTEDPIEKMRIFSPFGKEFMIIGGMGTNRIIAHEGKEGRYRILCATSSGLCDAGIPIVILEEAANKIMEPIRNNQTIEVDIKGRLVEMPFKPDDVVIPARGTILNQELVNYLGTTLNIPRNFILVESSLQIKRYISDFGLSATGWTLYGRKYGGKVTPSFTFATFNPNKDEDLKRAVEFMISYIEGHDGNIIYTDFDEYISHFDSKYSLSAILDDHIDQNEYKTDFENLTRLYNSNRIRY